MAAEGAAASEGKRDRDIIIDDRILRPDDTIHELTEVYEEPPRPNGKTGQGILVIDGRAYEEGAQPAPGEPVYELTEIVESRVERPYTVGGFNEEVTKRIDEIAERIAREIIPVVAERIIREEIEKLKKQ